RLAGRPASSAAPPPSDRMSLIPRLPSPARCYLKPRPRENPRPVPLTPQPSPCGRAETALRGFGEGLRRDMGLHPSPERLRRPDPPTRGGLGVVADGEQRISGGH